MIVDTAYLDRIADLKLYATVTWSLAGVILLLFGIFAARFSARLSAAQAGACESWFKRLHRESRATASMEYLMVLVPFLIIVMTIWQFAFMINARLHVGYATYAAARSAAVMIPAELDGEAPGTLEVKDDGKWSRIENATRPGTIAISPGTAGNAAGVYAAHNVLSGTFNVPQTPNGPGTLAQLTLMSMHMCETPPLCEPKALDSPGTRPLRTVVKNYYAQEMTTVSIQGTNSTQKLELGVPNPEVVKVRVDYVFWLQVPYVGRLLEALFKSPQGADTPLLNPYPSMILSEETSINVWYKKRAIDPCP